MGMSMGMAYTIIRRDRGEKLILYRTRYFKTSIPGAGIFLPVHRAEKRQNSPAISLDSSPTPAPQETPSGRSQFSKTVGPGVRPTSPSFKPRRPSLPRPESPFRKQPPNLAPTPARTLSQSQRGVRPGVTPSKSNLKASTNTKPSAPGQTPRPYSRTGSRLGQREEVGVATTSNGRTTSSGSVPSFSQPLRSPSRLGSAGGQESEIQRLKQQLAERDKRLEEQAASLADMEQSVQQLSAIIPQDGVSPGGRKGSLGEEEDQSAAQLRQMLREKNEKISMLTAEFDSHRADFRSTLDSLEMASTETERVYEEQKRDLLAQLAEMQEMSQNKEDFEGVAQQLKQLEEFVAELEEGLEESRRGEAEARGEVEFLRGEVERGRSELRREREKAAAALKNAENGGAETGGPTVKELEAKDDEIRGLKAIVHNLSSNSNGSVEEAGAAADPEEIKRLQEELESSQREKGDLEKEIEQLRRDSAMTNGNGTHARNESERTATMAESKEMPVRPRADTVKAASRPATEEGWNGGGVGNGVYCEMCDSPSHDTLDCGKLSTSPAKGAAEPDSPGKENEPAPADGKASVGAAKGGEVDEDKWCALCEKDGHLAFDCPEEQY